MKSLSKIIQSFPLKDGLNEEDMPGWKVLTYRLGEKILLVGDDLFVTNVARLREGIKENIANSILIKPNQIGTLTETLDAIETAAEIQTTKQSFLIDQGKAKIRRSQILQLQRMQD